MKNNLKIKLGAILLASTLLGATACGANSSAKDDKYANLEQKIQELAQENQQTTDSLNQKLQDLQAELEKTQNAFNESLADVSPLGTASYQKLKYIAANLTDRDCYSGKNFVEAQNYIENVALTAGYNENNIEFQAVPISVYKKKNVDLESAFSAAKSYETDGKSYAKNGRTYTEDENGDYIKATVQTENIIVTKQGKKEQQIIVGMHYDGTGVGDNGSGVALGLSALEKMYAVETDLTIKFIFFTAEEYGCYGSTYYAENMSETEIENTLYMINMDSLVCGDYTYLYGGVQDNETQTVNKTEAYENAVYIAKSLGLEFKSNPWTWGNLAPENYSGSNPDYASPSTGNWSDHKGFKNVGITYLYFEATNWEIPDYTGYGETVLTGMLMNTENDYLEYIETYFPGRILSHLTKFATLLNALCLQTVKSYTDYTAAK